ncbi:MAG: response regulator transcription factor [Deltaproteobacteria bacterium]|nr:response regulator transcription factor [Deltaproteobacteria bacterium]
MPRIVFVTAHDRYAIKAFEVHAFDYLLKPFAEERFREVLERARTQRSEAGGAVSRLLELVEQLKRARSFPDRLLVEQNQRAYFLPMEDILWIEADRNYLLIHSRTKTHTLRGTLEALAKTLDPQRFIRVNRSSLVQLDAICELRPWFHGEYTIVLRDSTELRWSRRFVAHYPELLGRPAGSEDHKLGF